MDMEWAKDGETGELFIVQARPETVQSQSEPRRASRRYRHRRRKGQMLVTGLSVGEKIAPGRSA